MANRIVDPHNNKTASYIVYKVIQNVIVGLCFAIVVIYIIGQFFIKNPPLFDTYCERLETVW